jgi:RHS repeat-associated protein
MGKPTHRQSRVRFASCAGSTLILVCWILTGISGAKAQSNHSYKKNGKPDCNEQCGDPINIATGNLFEEVLDYQTSGQNKLSLSRFYNGLAYFSTFATQIGMNWRTNYDRYLHLSATAVTAERADGRILVFTQNAGSWTPDSDVDITLTQNGSTWTLTDSDDTIEVYSVIGTGEAILTSIKARNGYKQTLTYNASNSLGLNLLVSVTDSYNRTLTFTYQNYRLQTVTTPDGLVITYGYGSGGQLTSVRYSTAPATSQSYVYENSSLPFALTGIVDENGNRFATWSYDSQGRALTSQHAGGADLYTVSYDDTTGNRSVTGPLGQVSLYKFATVQGAPKVSEIDLQATSTTAAANRIFTYDSNGYPASVTDWNGNLTTFVNDRHGQPTSITEASGSPQARTVTITYLSNFHLPSQIVTPGLTTTYTYDSNGNPLTRTLTDTTTTAVPYSTSGQTRTWTYTWSNFLLASVLGPRTDVSELTKYTYDGSGALTATTNALGQVTSITKHLPGGLPQTVVDANGVTTNISYDPRLRLVTSTVTAATGPLVTSYSYDAAGNLTGVTLPDGSAITNTWDPARRLTAQTDLLGNSIAYTLDAAGDRTKAAVAVSGGAISRQHSATFDGLGRMLSDVGGAGQTTAYTYDQGGNVVTITDPLQRVTQQLFDALNRRVQITDAAQGKSTLTYDAHNRLLAVTDPDGNTTSYTYDGFGDLIQEAGPARGTTVYRHDADGNLVQKVDARGAVANYTYDTLNRVLMETYPGDPAENVTYSYDQSSGGFGIGRLTSLTDAVGTLSRTYDERGNVLTESRVSSGPAAATLLTTYTYDGASRVASITYPSRTAVTYQRDTMGRVTGVTAQPQGASQPATVLSQIAYQPFGQPNGMSYGNGIRDTRTFDLDYRLTNLSDAGNQQVQKLTYAYNPANDAVSITDGVTPANSQSFGYDALDRLTSAAGGYGSLTYTYDAAGNRLTEGSAPTNLDRLGSVTAFSYNQAGRLASASAGSQQVTQYAYDPFGHRLSKTGASTGVSLFQYDRGGHLLEEADGQGKLRVDYIYLNGMPIAEYSGGKLYFLHTDRLGTPQAATDSTQAAVWVGNYQPFGVLSASSQTALLAQDLRLPGQENDIETGLYHNGFRDYAPGLGRYLEADPLSVSGRLSIAPYISEGAYSTPQTFNSYTYSINNPVVLTDPSGEDTATKCDCGEYWKDVESKLSNIPSDLAAFLTGSGLSALQNGLTAGLAASTASEAELVAIVLEAAGAAFAPPALVAGAIVGTGAAIGYALYQADEDARNARSSASVQSCVYLALNSLGPPPQPARPGPGWKY